MKKCMLPLLVLALCLLLAACDSGRSISGEVVDIYQDPERGTALILRTDNDKRLAVFLDEESFVFGLAAINSDAYKASPHTGVTISFSPKGLRTSLTTADGEKLKACHADRYISIDSYRVENAVLLSDGTPLDAWKTSLFGTTYRLKDGTELLREDAPSGPEDHYVGGLESFDDLSETAKSAVRQYYEEQGALYDLQAELERAYAAYQADPEHFSSYWVSQDTSPSASNGQIMYFQTNLFLTLAGNTGEECAVCAAFDRKTGAYIPTANLFTCPEADIGKKLLDLVAANGSGPDEPTLKRETLAAFQLEYVTISSHGLDMTFPQGTLPSQEYPYIVVVDRNDLPAVLHSWAIPDAPVA